MQWINDKTTELRQKMTEIGIPDFNVGYNSSQGSFHSINNSGNIYHTANISHFNPAINVERGLNQMRSSYGLYTDNLNSWDLAVDQGIRSSVSMGAAANSGGNGIIVGQSIDATLAIGHLGWTVEGGYYIDGAGKNANQFVSNGYTIGAEVSAGYNLIIIKPKANFKFSDLEGMGLSGTVNIGIVSISLLGNSAPGYPENSVAETYWGIKIGIGAGAGGSYTPNSNTSFFNWIPDITKSQFHWK